MDDHHKGKNSNETFSAYSEWEEEAPAGLADRFFRLLRWVLPVILIIVLILIVVEMLPEDRGDVSMVEEVSLIEDKGDLLNPSAFRAAFIEKNGGIDRIRALRSLRMDGSLRTGEEEREFFVIRHFPDRFLSRVYLDDGQFTFGITEQDRWRSLRRDNQLIEVVDLTYTEAKDVVRTTFPLHDSPLHLIGEGKGEIDLVEAVDYNGVIALRVRMKSTRPKNSVEYIFDRQTLVPLQRTEQMSDGSTLKWYFSEHRTVAGFSLPHKIALYQGDELESETTIWRMRHNVGVVSLTFERPTLTGR